MYHIKKDGTPGKCTAKQKPCPLGGESGEENHFATLKEAEAFASEQNMKKYGVVGMNPSEQVYRKLTQEYGLGGEEVDWDRALKDPEVLDVIEGSLYMKGLGVRPETHDQRKEEFFTQLKEGKFNDRLSIVSRDSDASKLKDFYYTQYEKIKEEYEEEGQAEIERARDEWDEENNFGRRTPYEIVDYPDELEDDYEFKMYGPAGELYPSSAISERYEAEVAKTGKKFNYDLTHKMFDDMWEDGSMYDELVDISKDYTVIDRHEDYVTKEIKYSGEIQTENFIIMLD